MRRMVNVGCGGNIEVRLRVIPECLKLPLADNLQPRQGGALVFVRPVCSGPILGNTVHRRGSDLDLERLKEKEVTAMSKRRRNSKKSGGGGGCCWKY